LEPSRTNVSTMDPYAEAVVGSKLKLKGATKTTTTKKIDSRAAGKKKKKKREPDEEAFVVLEKTSAEMKRDDLTEAERRHKKRAVAKRQEEVAKSVEKTHRERVDAFNEKLGSLTEHNDVPRISAAGNG